VAGWNLKKDAAGLGLARSESWSEIKEEQIIKSNEVHELS
jgi:hypothetical protein